ncbi:MAG: heavy metal translocating P-type ATPase [Pseudomonadota bacterium]
MSAELTIESAAQARGCPSGLAPVDDNGAATNTGAIDPVPFVRDEDGLRKLELAVFRAKCAGCISKIESAMLGLKGMQRARLNLSTGRLTLAWDTAADWRPMTITTTLQGLGYRAAPFDPSAAENDHDAEGRRLLRALGVAGFAVANVMLLSISVWAGGAEMGVGTRGLLHWASALIAIPAALYAGRPFFSSAWGALKNRHANMDVPISLAVILALSISIYEFFASGEHTYFDAAVMLLFFLLIGRYLDHRLRWRARAAARDLLAMQKTTAQRLDASGDITPIAASDVAVNDQLILSPGDRAPVDGVIIEGVSHADFSLVTGESAPVPLRRGGAVNAGVINLSNRLIMRATATVENSLVAELARLIEAGEQTRSRYVRLADHAARAYVPIVHSLALATFSGWMLLDGGFRLAITNAIAVLIITCPCALGLAAPAVQVVATGRLFKRGVLVKSGDALERLAQADAFVFDKTGTLTLGRPVLANREAISAEILKSAASLARISRHPLSRAIVEAAGKGRVCSNAKETPGLGVEGIINGRCARLGSAHWVGAPTTADDALESWYRLDDEPAVRFRFEDIPHPDAQSTLNALSERGFSTELLSGDRGPAVSAAAHKLGITNFRAGVSPQDKLKRLSALRADGVKVAMVGDGLNDAPSLAQAHVALSPGTAADASQASADFVYLGDGLSSIVEAVDVSRKARKRLIENFGFAALYNMCAIPLAVFGYVTPLIAALAMSGSSIVVTLNALRLAGAKHVRNEGQ